MRWMLKNRLAECRAAKRINKSQLAYYMHMSRGYVTRLERGDIRPSAEAMLRIARFFKRPVEQIFQLVEKAANGEGRTEISEGVHKNSFPASLGSVGEANNKAETIKGPTCS